MSEPDAPTQFDYDVSLSFAGEDRDYVSEVADALRSKGLRIFYDLYEESRLWGRDLYQHLDYVYSKAARFCVIFISRNYEKKLWTTHELKSAQARAFLERGDYILPARFDDTEIPGLRSTVGYIDLRSRTSIELADLIVDKIAPYKIIEFHNRRDYFPPTPDLLWKLVRARSKRAKQIAYRTAYAFYQALRRLDSNERLLVLTIFIQGCRHDFPRNAHIEIDLLRRIVGLPESQVRTTLANISSVGFEVRFLGPNGKKSRAPSYIYITWAHRGIELVREFEDLDAYSTYIAYSIVVISARHYCDEHAILALMNLNFSALSSATAVEHVHA